MQQQFDRPEMTKVTSVMRRAGEVAKEIRKSEAYPALIGGIAGGVAGALMAVIIAGRATSRPADVSSSEKKEARRGWSLKDVVQLVTIVATLAKQVQAWMKEQDKSK
jgi:hypothetical protein